MTFQEYAGQRLSLWLRIANGLARDEHLAQDLAQEVLIKLNARWDRALEIDSLDRYVHRMLTNEFLSWRRKWARIIPTGELPAGPAQPDPADAHADRANLDALIAELPPRQRVVIVLRYYADLPDLEIALIMGCSASAVRSYAARALASMRVTTTSTSATHRGA